MKRLALLALTVAACGPAEPPTAPLAGEIRTGSFRYICSITGEEAYIYVTAEGEELDPQPTGRTCSYETYRAWREGWGEPPPRQPPPNSLFEWVDRRDDA